MHVFQRKRKSFKVEKNNIFWMAKDESKFAIAKVKTFFNNQNPTNISYFISFFQKNIIDFKNPGVTPYLIPMYASTMTSPLFKTLIVGKSGTSSVY